MSLLFCLSPRPGFHHNPQGAALRATERESEMDKINVADKFSLFQERWTPKIVAELNGQHVKLAKVKGEMVWHSHADEDELFFIVKGALTLKLRDRDVRIEEGELFVVPRGVEHLPVAEEETWILLFEPVSTAHTGDVVSDMTVSNQEWI